MPSTKNSPSGVSSAVKRLLDAGLVSRVDEVTGVLQSLHANCPNDGERASVRRMSRELGGAIMEVTMRCPVCFTDFVATPASLYVSPRTSRAPIAAKAPARPAAKSSAKSTAKAAAKAPAKATAKAVSKAPAKAAKKAPSAAKAAKSAKSSKSSTTAKSAKSSKTAAKAGARTGRR
jgi:hypothetical protein